MRPIRAPYTSRASMAKSMRLSWNRVGIYMSPDWKTAEPFAAGLMRDLDDINKLVQSWRQVVIESERSRVETLAASIDQFVKFRTELVRLAREETTAKARLFGDNDANRKVRSELNKRLNDLEKAYLGHEEEAHSYVESVNNSNFKFLIAIAGHWSGHKRPRCVVRP